MVDVLVEPSIFKDYPTFRRGLVLAVAIQNRGPSKELEAELDEALARAAREPIRAETAWLLRFNTEILRATPSLWAGTATTRRDGPSGTPPAT